MERVGVYEGDGGASLINSINLPNSSVLDG